MIDPRGEVSCTCHPSARWYCYLLECADGTLYTGITTDPERRIRQHNHGTGAKYTRARLPVRLVHVEEYANRANAARRERQIKALSRRQKQALIRQDGSGRITDRGDVPAQT